MGALTNEFLVTVRVTQLAELQELYRVLSGLKALAQSGIAPINIGTTGRPATGTTTTAAGGVEVNSAELNASAKAHSEAAAALKEAAAALRQAATATRRTRSSPAASAAAEVAVPAAAAAAWLSIPAEFRRIRGELRSGAGIPLPPAPRPHLALPPGAYPMEGEIYKQSYRDYVKQWNRYARNSAGRWAGNIGPGIMPGRAGDMVPPGMRLVTRQMYERMYNDLYNAALEYARQGRPMGGSGQPRMPGGPAGAFQGGPVGYLPGTSPRTPYGPGVGYNFFNRAFSGMWNAAKAAAQNAGYMWGGRPYVGGGRPGAPIVPGQALVPAGAFAQGGNWSPQGAAFANMHTFGIGPAVKSAWQSQDKFGELHAFAAKARQLLYYAIGGGIIFGALYGFKKATDELLKFEYEIAKIRGFFDDRSLNVKLQIEQGTIQAAKDYGLALSEVVRVTKFFAQAGFSPTESLIQMRSTLKAAAALDIEPVAAAQTAISVREISKGRVSTSDIFERIARVERLNAVTAEDLNTAIQRVGGFMTQLQPKAQGVVDGFDLVIGATTQIVEQTRVTGNQAANALKFFVARLSAPEIASKLQDQFGIRLAANPEGTEFRPLIEILQDVADTYKGLRARGGETANIRASQLLSTIAGARQIALAEALFSNFDKAMEVARMSALSFGDTEDRLKLIMDTTIRQLGRLGSSFVGFLNQLAQNTGALTGFKSLLSSLTDDFSSYKSNPQTVGEALKPFGTLALMLGGIRVLFAGFGALGRGKGVISDFAALGDLLGQSSPLIGTGRRIEHTAEVVASTSAGRWMRGQGYYTPVNNPLGQFTGVYAFNPSAVTKGVGVFARILQGVTTLFGPLLPLAIITGIGALVAWIVQLHRASQVLPKIKPVSEADVLKTEFGKEYAATAESLGLKPGELASRVAVSSIMARERVYEMARAELNKPANLQDKDLVRLADRGVLMQSFRSRSFENRAVRAVTEQELTRSLLDSLSRIPGTLEALQKNFNITYNPEDRGRTFTTSEIYFMQQQVRRAIQFYSAPDEMLMKARTEKLGELTSNLDISASLGRRFPTPNFATVFGTAPSAPSLSVGAIQNVRETFSSILPKRFGFGLDRFYVEVDNTGRKLTGMAAALDAVTQAGGDAAKGLEQFFGATLTTAGGLNADVVTRNRANLRNSLVFAISQYAYDNAPDNETRRRIEAARNQGTGEQAFRTVFKEAIDIVQQQLPEDSPLLKQLKEADIALSKMGKAYKGEILRDLTVLAQVGDKVGQIISKLVADLTSLQAVEPIFNQLGVGINAAQERYDLSKAALREMLSIPGVLAGDIIAQSLKVQQMSALASRAITISTGESALSDADQIGIYEDQADANSPTQRRIDSKELATRRLESAKRQLEMMRSFMETVLTNSELLSYASEGDKQIMYKAFAESLSYDKNKLSEEDIAKIQLTPQSFIDILKKLVEISQKDAYALKERLAWSQRQFDIVQQQVGFQRQLYQVTEAATDATLLRRFGTLGTTSFRRAGIIRRRNEAVEDANREYLKSIRDLEASKLTIDSPEWKIAMDDAQHKLNMAIADAYNTATLNMAELLTTTQTEIMDQTQDRIRTLVEDGLSGLKSLLVDTGQLFEGSPKKNLRNVLGSASNTIMQNTVDNLFRTLVGPGGLFEEQVGKFFGFNEEIRKNVELKRLHTEATHDGVLAALRDVGFVSSNYGNNTQSGPGAGATAAMAAVLGLGAGFAGRKLGVDITGGGYSPYGPNAGADPLVLAQKQAASEARGKNAKMMKEQLKKYLATFAAITGGTLLGGLIGGKGIRRSYAGEGANIGAAIGSLIPGLGILGTVGGGLLGGLIGGLFGKSAPPKPPRPPAVLEKIERNTRESALALENQNRMLFNLDSRLLNLPATFTVPSYRPEGVDGAAGTNQYVFNISGTDPQAIAAEVEKVLVRQDRLRGSFTSIRRGS